MASLGVSPKNISEMTEAQRKIWESPYGIPDLRERFYREYFNGLPEHKDPEFKMFGFKQEYINEIPGELTYDELASKGEAQKMLDLRRYRTKQCNKRLILWT